MEWQANYLAGALLMPESRIRLLVEAYFGNGDVAPTRDDAPEATGLKQRVAEAFYVSQEAAGVRLSQLQYIVGRVS